MNTDSDSNNSRVHINNNQIETNSEAATSSSKLSKTDDEVIFLFFLKNIIFSNLNFPSYKRMMKSSKLEFQMIIFQMKEQIKILFTLIVI